MALPPGNVGVPYGEKPQPEVDRIAQIEKTTQELHNSLKQLERSVQDLGSRLENQIPHIEKMVQELGNNLNRVEKTTEGFERSLRKRDVPLYLLGGLLMSCVGIAMWVAFRVWKR